MKAKSQKLEDLGYDPFFESNRVECGLDVFDVARVISEQKGSYKVKNINDTYVAKITGKQIFQSSSREDYPSVGDWVVISELDDRKAMIRSILPRKTVMKRKCSGKKNETQIIATNIDVAFIVESVDRDYNLNRCERYFAIARDGGIKPAIILNKADLISKEELYTKASQIKDRFNDVDVISTSTLTDAGLNELKKFIKKGKTHCFMGSSGVGKSSLINKLIGDESEIKTGDVGLRSGRGKHVTTTRDMYFLKNGGIVIDTPGMREVGMTDGSAGVDNAFDEITILAKKCKFIDCDHIHEPKCEVLVALKAGLLDEEKYANYIRLKKESAHYEMTAREKKEKDRKLGKFMKNAKKDLKKYKNKNY